MDNARHWFHLERTQAQLTVRLQDMRWSQPLTFADVKSCEQAIAQSFPASHILRAKPALGGEQTYFVRGTMRMLRKLGFDDEIVNAVKRHSSYDIGLR